MTVSLDTALWFVGIVGEGVIVALLAYRRVWRTLPVFCVFSVWSLLSDGGNYAVQRYFANSYLTIYLAEAVVDSVLLLGVLVEIAWSVLRPIRAKLSGKALVVVGVVILAVGAAIWPFSGIHGLAKLPAAWQYLVHLQQTASILRILFFLVLAGCSQLLSIGWRDRELQVATGLGFYSIVSLAVEIVHSHYTMGPQYAQLNQIVVASYFCSLLYWAFSFASKEAERREFTPQMQSFLLAVAGNARASRIALAESPTPLDRKPRNR
jgi:hypothetical protein